MSHIAVIRDTAVMSSGAVGYLVGGLRTGPRLALS